MPGPFQHFATRVYDDQIDENRICVKALGYDFDSVSHPAIERSRLTSGEYFLVATWRGGDDPYSTKPCNLMFITFDEFVRDNMAFDNEAPRIGVLTRMSR